MKNIENVLRSRVNSLEKEVKKLRERVFELEKTKKQEVKKFNYIDISKGYTGVIISPEGYYQPKYLIWDGVCPAPIEFVSKDNISTIATTSYLKVK